MLWYIYIFESKAKNIERSQLIPITDILLTWFLHFCILQLWCCGLTNYTDWQGTPWGQGHPDKLPYSCCQFTTEAVCSAYKETAAVHRTVIIHDQITYKFLYFDTLTPIHSTIFRFIFAQRFYRTCGVVHT